MIKIRELKGVESIQYGKNKRIESCRFSKENKLVVGGNTFIPKYMEPDIRSKYREAISFYEDGGIRSIYLEGVQPVKINNRILDAELVTFYRSGAIHRIFPLYGQLSAYWTEENEKELAKTINIQVGENEFTNKVSCLCLYQSGAVRSLTFYSGEKYEVKVGNRKITGRIGISFYENGQVESVEPVFKTYLDISGEKRHVYAPFACGINGDVNSLKFNEKGEIIDYYGKN